MTENYKRLIKLLKELFQIDRPDLDFGIYRIMNQKRDEIISFLDKDLLPQVKKAFAAYGSGGRGDIQAELDKMVANLKDAGIDPNSSPKVKELKGKLNASVDVTELENEVYSYLYNFFRRYYKDGDFLSLRRYKKDVYAIPYEGEEVKLHWANADQYYIKSSENFRDYTFKLGELPGEGEEDKRKIVHFKLIEADTELANNKAQEGKKRRFVLCSDSPMIEDDGELFIRFEYKPLAKKQAQKKLNESAVKTLLDNPEYVDWIRELAREENGTSILEKHVNSYTAKNSFDYFIHKDLGGFLRRELDFFIKNEVMHLDDIEEETVPRVEQYLSQIKVLRQIAHKLISFLEQLENFQKKLWLKKKFVVETNYGITLDRVPEELYSEICANDAQREEWVRLFAIDEIKGGAGGLPGMVSPAYSVPLTKDFLEANDKLVLDTAFFSSDFKVKLIASIEYFDEQCDGLLIHSENFQALNLLQERYREQVKCVYIDPPYNTGDDGFLYKDNYQHSTWLSMVNDRLSISKSFLSMAGTLSASINDNETQRFELLLKNVFGVENYQVRLGLKVRHEDRILRADIPYQEVLEDIHIVSKSCDFKPGRRAENNAEEFSDYTYQIEIIDETARKILSIGGFDIEFYPQNAYRINTHSEGEASHLKRYTIRGSLITQKGSASEFYELNLRSRRPIDGFGGLYKVLGMGTKGDGLGYRYIMQPLEGGGDNGIYFQGVPLSLTPRSKPYATYYDLESAFNRCSDEGGVPFRGGKKPQLLFEKLFPIVDFPSNGELLMDFFAGSGSSGQAAIQQSRLGIRTKFLLIEMSDYFDTVTKPRITKVIYSSDWKNGKPTSRDTGISQCFKYIRLESYEDTLNNLTFKQNKDQVDLLAGSPALKEEYMLSYMMDIETEGSSSLLNVKRFDNPWNYTIKVSTGSAGETRTRSVDLVETFNYLIGLTVIRRDFLKGIEVIQGTNPEGENVLVIWRNTKETSNEQLDEFFRKQDFNTRDSEFDLIYVNGDNNLENLKKPDETWKVRLIEEDFKRLMFEVEDV
jgi:adenine-specific DNA-methyltransferase